MAKKKGSGRPRKYNKASELEEAINKYFDDPSNSPFTITGLTLFLGFADRRSIYDYLQNDLFSYSIKRALTIIEKQYEEKLASGGAGAGEIFMLKNFGWKDKPTEREESKQTVVNIVVDKDFNKKEE